MSAMSLCYLLLYYLATLQRMLDVAILMNQNCNESSVEALAVLHGGRKRHRIFESVELHVGRSPS
jgi:hypothetical protein